MTDPPHWHRPAGSRAGPGPVVVFDLDGVISDASHRQRYLDGHRRDWDGFFRAAVDDPLIIAGATLAATVVHPVVVLTARPGWIGADTIGWLDRHDVIYDLLVIRPDGDHRSSVDYKRAELAALRAAGFDVRLALDDDRSIVAMYEQQGVPTVSVHSGYYDR